MERMNERYCTDVSNGFNLASSSSSSWIGQNRLPKTFFSFSVSLWDIKQNQQPLANILREIKKKKKKNPIIFFCIEFDPVFVIYLFIRRFCCSESFATFVVCNVQEFEKINFHCRWCCERRWVERNAINNQHQNYCSFAFVSFEYYNIIHETRLSIAIGKFALLLLCSNKLIRVYDIGAI